MVVGLGDIARKAYLPVLGVRPDLELHLVTRDAAALRELGRAWRAAGRHRDVDAALAATGFDAAFVHAATEAHPPLVERLLAARVPVFVDKPLADSHVGALRLADAAVHAAVPLFVGFNRRHAPVYADLRSRPRTAIRMAKDRRGPRHPARRTVFDDFIHVVDTLRFLAPGPVHVAAIETLGGRDGLEAIELALAGDGFVATGSMHRAAGDDGERLDVLGGGSRTIVVDMGDVVRIDGDRRRIRRGDWVPVARQRGFEAMCDAFLELVASGRPHPVEDMLETHRICEAITAHAERRA